MRRTSVLLLALAVLCVGANAFATGPDEGPTKIPTGRPTRLTGTPGFAGSSETTIAGIVTDEEGTPLLDVSVKLYIGGLLAQEELTSTDGSFEISMLIDYGRDVTIDLWFVPSGGDLVMENIILKESSAAVQGGLYSKCVKRVRLDPLTDVFVKLTDIESRSERIRASGCAG